MKKLFFAVLVLVMNLSANATNWKQGESKDFNPMKKDNLQMTPEQFQEAIKNDDMSWSREKISLTEYCQQIADWNNATEVWKLAGFKGPLTVPMVKYMIVNSKPMLITVPAGAMKIMGSDPKNGLGWFYNQYEMDVKFLTFKADNGYVIPLVKFLCFNGVGGFAVSPEVITVTKTVTKEEVRVRDSIVIREVPVEKVILKEVTVVNRVAEGVGGCFDCYAGKVYCSGCTQPAATGFGFNLSLNFTKVQQQQASQPINISISNPVTVISTNTNNNNNQQQQQQQNAPVVLQPEVIVPVTPQGHPAEGNPTVTQTDGPNPSGNQNTGNNDNPNPSGNQGNPSDDPNPSGNPLAGSGSGNSARIASVSPQAGSGKFGSKDQTTAKVTPTEKTIATVAPQQKPGKFGQVTSQTNSGSKIAATPVQQTTVKSGKFGQSNSQSASVVPTNNQSARTVQPTYNNGSSAKYNNQNNSYSPQPVYTNKPANVNYGNGSARFSNNSSSMNNSGARMNMNIGPRPGSGKFK